MKFLLFCVFATLGTSLRMPSSVSPSMIQRGGSNADNVDAFNNYMFSEQITAGLTMLYLKHWEAKPNHEKRNSALKNNKPGKVAIFIPGLQDRLLLKSKLDKVIVPLFEQGYTVDLYTHLIASGKQEGKQWAPVKNGASFPETNVTDLCGLLQEKVKDVANLAYCKLAQEPVNIDAHKAIMAQKQLPRLWIYNDFPGTKENVMRRLFALQHLMKVSTFRGDYDYYLITKDDEYWFAPLDISALPDKSPNNLYSKECGEWGGLNDKTFLFGREAAKKTLLNLYTDFVMDDPRLDTGNNEQYWKAYTDLKGIKSVPVPFNQLQTSDAVYQQRGSSLVMCIKEMYLCDKNILSPKTPQLCEE